MPISPTGRDFPSTSQPLPCIGSEMPNARSCSSSPCHCIRETVLPGGARLVLRRAGHILGAATAQIDIGGKRLVFSGDLGRYDDMVMPDPEPSRKRTTSSSSPPMAIVIMTVPMPSKRWATSSSVRLAAEAP